MTDSLQPVPIAFCITGLNPGGAERALVQIVTRLDRAQWSPHVFSLTGDGSLAAELRAADIPVTALHIRRWWPFTAVSRFTRHLRRLQPAVLQTFLYHADILGRWAARRAGVPVIVSGIRVAERRSWFRLWLNHRTERWVMRHVCVSRAVAEFSTTTGRLNPEKIVVIPNGVDFERFAGAQPVDLSEFGIGPEAKTVLAVGRLDPQKGTLELLEAFSSLAARDDSVHLLLVGTGPLQSEVERMRASKGLLSRVHLPGFRDDVPGLMRAADLLVLASRWEGLPNAVLEAMAAGLPVVATAVDGTRELIQPGETGRLVGPGDVSALAAEMEAALQNSQQSEEMAAAAQGFVSQHYRWDAVAEAYHHLYRRLLSAADSPAAGR